MSDHDELPLPDYDHLPQGSLMHRLRSLTENELQRIRDYERTHADRPAVLELIDARLSQLASGETPSSGDQRIQPESAPPPSGGSPVSEDSKAEPRQPLRHGVAEQTPNRTRQ
jgi:hypothetical protein